MNDSSSLQITCLADMAPVNEASDVISKDVSLYKKYFYKNPFDAVDPSSKEVVLSSAKNHILDFDIEGLFETIGHLKAKSLKFSGAGTNLEEAGKADRINSESQKIGFPPCAHERFPSAGKDGRRCSYLTIILPIKLQNA